MSTFCFRLLFHLGMAVASDQTEVNLQTTLCPNPLKLKARTGTLSTSRELAIEILRLCSEEEARGFGTRVLNAMLIGGIVTEAAGMTHGSLYSQFGSKERLVEEALDYVMAASAQNMDGAATLADYVAGYLTASHRDMPGRGCPLAALCCARAIHERIAGNDQAAGQSNGLRAEATAARRGGARDGCLPGRRSRARPRRE